MKSIIKGTVVYKTKEDSEKMIQFLNRFKIKHKLKNETLIIDDCIPVCRLSFNDNTFKKAIVYNIGKCETQDISVSRPMDILELAELLDENLL